MKDEGGVAVRTNRLWSFSKKVQGQVIKVDAHAKVNEHGNRRQNVGV